MAKFNPNQKINFTQEQIRMATEAIRAAKDVKCKCGCDVFAEGLKLKVTSKILSGDTENRVLPFPVMYCIKCQEILMPDDIDKIEEKKEEN